VGDSSQQNSAYMVSGEFKKELIKKKEQTMMRLTIKPYKIITIINYAWSRSFARPVSNKKTIAERGWYPLNRALLLNAGLRATMTEQQQEEEVDSGIFFPIPTTLALPTNNPPTTPTYDPTFLALSPSDTPKDQLNFPKERQHDLLTLLYKVMI